MIKVYKVYFQSSLISVLTKFCELWIKSNEMHVCLGRLPTRRVCWCRALASVVEKSNELRILPLHSCNSEMVSKSKGNSPIYVCWKWLFHFVKYSFLRKQWYFRNLHFRNLHWQPISDFFWDVSKVEQYGVAVQYVLYAVKRDKDADEEHDEDIRNQSLRMVSSRVRWWGWWGWQWHQHRWWCGWWWCGWWWWWWWWWWWC